MYEEAASQTIAPHTRNNKMFYKTATPLNTIGHLFAAAFTVPCEAGFGFTDRLNSENRDIIPNTAVRETADFYLV